MIFKNRKDAAEKLAAKLQAYKNKKDTLILAIPRGGVEIGYYLSLELNLPLDIVVTKKIGFPGQEELAIGAVDAEGNVEINKGLMKAYSIGDDYIKIKRKEIKKMIDKKLKHLRGDAPLPDIEGKTIILTDDGIATGFTVKSALHYLQNKNAKEIIIAVPVSAKDALTELKKEASKVVCLYSPVLFGAVGQFYENFEQVSDAEVREFLKTKISEQYMPSPESEEED